MWNCVHLWTFICCFNYLLLSSTILGESAPGHSPISIDQVGNEIIPEERGSGYQDAPEKEDYFHKLTENFGAGGERMNEDALSGLIKILTVNVNCEDHCDECFDANKLVKTYDANMDNALNVDEFDEVATVLLYYLMNGMNLACNSSEETIGSEEVRETIFQGNSICPLNTSKMIEEIQQASCPAIRQCLNTIEYSSLIEDDCIQTTNGSDVISRIIFALVECRCFLPAKEYFMEEVFELVETENGSLTTRGFQDLLGKLEIGGRGETGIEHEHRRKRSVEDDEESHDEMQTCYSGEELLSIFDLDEATGITRSQFLELCPSLVQQVASGACNPGPHVQHRDPDYTTAMMYGYGTASVLVISALAFVGLFMFPALNSPWYKVTMQFFIALGVGAMSADAILHIIPEIIGLHDHEENSSGENEEEENKTYIWRLLAVIGGIYLFYLFETSIRLWNKLRNSNVTLHLHQHESGDHDHSLENGNSRAKHHQMTNMTSLDVDEGEITNNNDESKAKTKEASPAKEGKMCGNISTLVIMVLIGDILHNFGDGIAIGVAFSTSSVSGLGTSIAIFCHELPHEFGDFALYLKNGLTKWQALGANFVSACTAFIGLYIGIGVAEDPAIRMWMLAVIAGMFLYISLVDVLHEMMEENTFQPVTQFLLQHFGLLFGWVILLIIALYEDDIAKTIS